MCTFLIIPLNVYGGYGPDIYIYIYIYRPSMFGKNFKAVKWRYVVISAAQCSLMMFNRRD